MFHMILATNSHYISKQH